MAARRAPPLGRPRSNCAHDGNVFPAKGPPSRGANPTSGEHLDQTAAMKAQLQTRVFHEPPHRPCSKSNCRSSCLKLLSVTEPLKFGIAPYSRRQMSLSEPVGFDYPPRERGVCDRILAVLGTSLGFNAVMRGSSSSGWGLGAAGTGGPFQTCLHQRFE